MLKHYDLLSDAMLEGAKLRPQGRRALVDTKGRTCALGAANHAIYGVPDPPINLYSETSWDFLLKSTTEACPVRKCSANLRIVEKLRVLELIEHLNDDHKWTREQIAGWLSTVEERLGMVEIVSDDVKAQPLSIDAVESCTLGSL